MAENPLVGVVNDDEFESQSLDNDSDEEEDELPVDVSKLTWPGYMLHVTCLGGKKSLAVIDTMGEWLADFFGITGPKYWYIIEEYERQKAKEKRNHIEGLQSSDQVLEGGVSD